MAFEYAFWTNGYRYLEELSLNGYRTEAELLRDIFVAEGIGENQEIQEFADRYGDAYGLRITIIDRQGEVVGESNNLDAPMTNHLDREEVKAALLGETFSTIRESETFQIDYCYCAVPVETEAFSGVMRLAIPLDEMLGMENAFLKSITLALLVLWLIAVGAYLYFKHYMAAMRKVENMRKEFVSNVTHELKTPLTSIRGFVETLKAGAIQDEKYAGKFLGIIDMEAQRLTNLIDDTLLLSEIESQKELEKAPCDVNTVIREVVELLEPKVREHVRLIFKLDPRVRPYVCNRDRMKQLLINLIDNGLKATEFGAVTVSCRSEEKDLVLKIVDTGIGMEEEQLERIFERFYRVDKGRSKAQGGTGLGLSIVKHIVENYHGTIHVTSKVGVGSEFTVRLPYEVTEKMLEKSSSWRGKKWRRK